MYNRNIKPGSTPQKGSPFICRLMPFVCTKNPVISPLVGCKLPLVEICKITNGFTLIELIVTLTIAGILMAVAAPNMGNFIKDQRLSGQTNDLVGDLNFARSEAIKRSTNITICKQDSASTAPLCNTTAATPWSAGRVIFIDTNGDGLVDTAEIVLRNREILAGNNTLTSAATTTPTSLTHNAANRIVYTSTGLTTVNTGEEASLRFCDSRGINKAIDVQINSTGRSRIDRTPAGTCP